MSRMESTEVEKTLAKSDVHKQWEDSFRTSENEKFYEISIAHIAKILNAPKDSLILDVGCGIGAHSIRFARHGYRVLGVDFSESIIEEGKNNIEMNSLSDKVSFQRENILSLSFPDNSFDYILCWGVLMHMPDVEKAISELVRVLRKGGTLVVSEGNMHALDLMLVRGLKYLLGKNNITVNKTNAGIENWTATSAGKLLTRQANVRWLKKQFRSHGCIITKHIAGQFTESYTRFRSKFASKLIHGFNNFYFRFIKIPLFSFGNIIIIQKEK